MTNSVKARNNKRKVLRILEEHAEVEKKRHDLRLQALKISSEILEIDSTRKTLMQRSKDLGYAYNYLAMAKARLLERGHI